MLLEFLHHVVVNTNVQDALDLKKEGWRKGAEDWKHFGLDFIFFDNLKEYVTDLSPDIKSKAEREAFKKEVNEGLSSIL